MIITKKNKNVKSFGANNTLLTLANVQNKIKQYLQSSLFYQVQMAQVRKIMTIQDVDQETYPAHYQGAIKARILFTQNAVQQQKIILMTPRDPYFKRVPVKGQIVLCSQHIDFTTNVNNQPKLNQYYYFGILNILNQTNNNSVIDITDVAINQTQAELQQQKCGQNFYIDWTKKNFNIDQGDVVISGRYGNGLKFTNTTTNNKMLPKTLLINNTDQMYNQQDNNLKKENYNNCGSLISLQQNINQPQNLIQIASNRNLLNQKNQLSLIGNNIISNSDRIILNAKKNDIQMYANDNIQVSSNNNVLIESQNIIIEGNKEIVFKVGDNQIIINKKQVRIKANKIVQQGQSILENVIDGVTPGYLKIGICPFSGQPITTKSSNK